MIGETSQSDRIRNGMCTSSSITVFSVYLDGIVEDWKSGHS